METERAERLGGLFDTHADRLYRLARRLTSSADDALDLVQETFLRAASSPTAIPDGRGSEEAWLVRILMNIRRDQWRKQAVRRRYLATVTRSRVPQNTPESAYVSRADVWKALDSIAPRRRAILVMHELEGMPASAVASLLGITTITVRWHLSRGRRELGRRFNALAGDTDEQHPRSVARWRSTSSRNTTA